MKFSIRENKTMMAHLMLGSVDVCEKVRHTPQWADDGELEATLQINGVEVPAQVMEDFLLDLWERAEKAAGEKVDESRFNERVQDAVNKTWEEQTQPILEIMTSLHNKLQEADQLIKYSWED